MHQHFSAGFSFPNPRGTLTLAHPSTPCTREDAKPSDAGTRQGAGSSPKLDAKGCQHFHNLRGRRRLM